MSVSDIMNVFGGSTFGAVGNMLNNITGAKQMQKDAQNFAKWQMRNSHQMEVQDLLKAGLNPVLSAGGSGATAGGVGAAPTSGTDPITMASQIVGMLNSTKQIENETNKMDADIINQTNETDANVIKALADAEKAGADKEQINKIIEYYGKHGVFPGATVSESSSIEGSGSLLGIKGSGGSSSSITYPVGYKGPKNNTKTQTQTIILPKTNSAKKPRKIKVYTI